MNFRFSRHVSRHAVALALATFAVSTSFTPVALASATDGPSVSSERADAPFFNEKTKAVSGFAIGSLAGLLLGGRKGRKDGKENKEKRWPEGR